MIDVCLEASHLDAACAVCGKIHRNVGSGSPRNTCALDGVSGVEA